MLNLKKIINMKLTRVDLDQLHDLILNALEIDIKDDSEIKRYWDKLPNDIKADFKHWGLGDTPTRDNAYLWLQANCKTMTKKEQISKFLREWNGDGYTTQDVYIEKECADLMAEEIVKLFFMPDTLGQSERFVCDCTAFHKSDECYRLGCKEKRNIKLLYKTT